MKERAPKYREFVNTKKFLLDELVLFLLDFIDLIVPLLCFFFPTPATPIFIDGLFGSNNTVSDDCPCQYFVYTVNFRIIVLARLLFSRKWRTGTLLLRRHDHWISRLLPSGKYFLALNTKTSWKLRSRHARTVRDSDMFNVENRKKHKKVIFM